MKAQVRNADRFEGWKIAINTVETGDFVQSTLINHLLKTFLEGVV